jgi:hypothetical protein
MKREGWFCFLFWVMEYGENIGTVKNLFTDMRKALGFARRIMQCSGRDYQATGRHEWYCVATQEYIKVEKTQPPV